jgi:hypothetical protein
MYWDDTDGIKSNCCDRAGHLAADTHVGMDGIQRHLV